jgi:hypothetical protein
MCTSSAPRRASRLLPNPEVPTSAKPFECIAGRSFDAVSISRDDAQAGRAQEIWWVICDSQEDLQRNQMGTMSNASCSSFGLAREDCELSA